MTITKATDQDAAFILDKEGSPLRAYKDIGGVVTIGPGFTMGSKTFAAYWKTTRGRGLQMGDTITKSECVKLLRSLLDNEYGKAVAAQLLPQAQHVYGASTSVAYNAGLGSLKWKWAQSVRMGSTGTAAKLLLTTAITVQGKVSQGLKNRRAAESHLMLSGDYGTIVLNAPSAESLTVDQVKEYQKWLKDLGFYSGYIDGLRGPLTKGAVSNFQRANDLLVDGKVGPATRATILRRLAEKTGRTTTGTISVGAGTVSPALPNVLASPLSIVLIVVGVAVVLSLGFWLWSNRGLLTGRRTIA